MGILVDRVRISNFRSLHNVEVALSPVTVLVGMNNSGKTSFLKALHLALGSDRRVVSADDFYMGQGIGLADNPGNTIVIDLRIIPLGENGERIDEFDDAWINSELGGGLINFDKDARQYVAVRTRVVFDPLRNDYAIQRFVLNDWRENADWLGTPEKQRLRGRFEQIVAFLMDAQRDVVGDLRNRTSYIGRLLTKVEIPPEAVKEIEDQLSALNTDIVAHSELLSHVRDSLSELNRTVPSYGKGVEITPVSKKLRDITKSLDVQFSDSDASTFALDWPWPGHPKLGCPVDRPTRPMFPGWTSRQSRLLESLFIPSWLWKSPRPTSIQMLSVVSMTSLKTASVRK